MISLVRTGGGRDVNVRRHALPNETHRMIARWIGAHRDEFPADWNEASSWRGSGDAEAPPFEVMPEALIAIALCSAFRHGAARSSFDRPPMATAKKSSLLAKGRSLFDHCVSEGSSVCVIGFVDHELSKSKEGLDMVLDFLAAIARVRMEESAGKPPVELEIIEEMLDVIAGLVLGVDEETTRSLRLA